MSTLGKYFLIFLVAVSMAACSSSQTTEDGEEMMEDVPSADADTDLVPEEDLAELEEEEFEEEEEIPEETPIMEEEEVAEAEEPEAPIEETPMMEESSAEPTYAATSSPAMSGNWVNYTVKSGDTLMKIAFETYANVYEWRRIYDANQAAIGDYNTLSAGTVLKIEQPDAPVQIERNGTPYLIKIGDTLGTISRDVYGTDRKWKRLWENNRQLIRDPNKIYAGFYLYYTLTAQDEQEKTQFMSSPMAEAPAGGGAAESVPNFQGATEAMELEEPAEEGRAPGSG